MRFRNAMETPRTMIDLNTILWLAMIYMLTQTMTARMKASKSIKLEGTIRCIWVRSWLAGMLSFRSLDGVNFQRCGSPRTWNTRILTWLSSVKRVPQATRWPPMTRLRFLMSSPRILKMNIGSKIWQNTTKIISTKKGWSMANLIVSTRRLSSS